MTKLLKHILPAFVLMIVLTTTACGSHVPANSTALPASETVAAPVETQVPVPASPTEMPASASLKQYANNAFGFSFLYPSSWFGPDVYISGQTLRVEVGSDKVYPYGEPPAEPSGIKNSYLVVIQYSKNGQDQSWKDTYSALSNLKDGESLAGTRSLIIRVGQIELGRFKGFEFISTLPESAQTENVFAREALLVDPQSNLLTIFGTPNNVEVSNGGDWREVYQSIDKANLTNFQEIMESIKIE